MVTRGVDCWVKDGSFDACALVLRELGRCRTAIANSQSAPRISVSCEAKFPSGGFAQRVPLFATEGETGHEFEKV